MFDFIFCDSSISSVFNNFEIKKQPPPNLFPEQPLETQTHTPIHQKKLSTSKIVPQRKSVSFLQKKTRRNSKSHSNKLDGYDIKEDYPKKSLFENK